MEDDDDSSYSTGSKRSEAFVTSEVNNSIIFSGAEIKPRKKSTNKVAKLRFSTGKRICAPNENRNQRLFDQDEDLELPSEEEEKHVLIEYQNSTSLPMVGLQMWRGAFILSDFIVEYSKEYFQGKKVIELGAGTGLCGIVASIFASSILCTDLNEPEILDLIKVNVEHNCELINASFNVDVLDFLETNWNQKLCQQIDEADVFIAADVIYNMDITSGFVATIGQIIQLPSVRVKSKNIFIALEKRYVFTTEALDSHAPMFEDFLEKIDRDLGLSLSSPKITLQYIVTLSFLETNFKQHFNYEKTKELVLLHFKLDPVNRS